MTAIVNPLRKPLSLFLVALSLSIGWGIRGDFGHESGAWIPGALAAIAVCLLSRREDWQRRVAHCALFGGLGWGFGGSISYMYTLSFAGSGQWETVWYGYFAVFFVGGLWAGLGGAGTALPLCLDRDHLTRLFTPLCFVLAAIIVNQFLEPPLAELLKSPDAIGADGTWKRHKSPLYWLDADWLPALWALIGVCLYDLWDRRFAKALLLVPFAAGGALAGWIIQALLAAAGLVPALVRRLVVPLGDTAAISPETGKLFDPGDLLTNWPQFFADFPQHVGWWIGLTLGIACYFWRYGHWRNGSGLFLYMALGWLLAFLLMPVLGTAIFSRYGGFRLTPPRSDDWAGITGVFVGICLYSVRHGLAPVAYAGALNFVLGGISFASMHFFRALILIPGHPDLNAASGGTPPAWKHFHSANWHSFLEQSQGFGFGLITAITMSLLWMKLKPAGDDPPARRWTSVFSVAFVLLFMTYVNVVKNVSEWTRPDHPLVPALMKAPLIEAIQLSAAAWFNLAWCAISLAVVGLMIRHLRRPLAIVPSSWIGRGQLIYVLLLWIMVIADFERSLNGFTEGRLLTEWVIIINAALATFLALALPEPALHVEPAEDFVPPIRSAWLFGLGTAAILMTLYAGIVFGVYGKAKISGAQYRWGEDAVWRTKPILKNRDHR